MYNDIDFVIIWVDDGDLDWQKERAKYSQSGIIDVSDKRYRDWDNLKYWFRCVEKFAPWVRTIHFVTCGQKPEWLNESAAKLHMVSHNDYMPQEYLPTFNANPIELNLHRIQGLAEQFVFFNDDMFIIKPVKKTDFFKKGLPRTSIGIDLFCYDRNNVFSSILQNDMQIFRKYFNNRDFIRKNWKKIFNPFYGLKDLKSFLLFPWTFYFIPGFFNHHLPNSFLKSTFREVWGKEYELLHRVSQNKFRSAEDVNQYVMEYWQYGKGLCKPKSQTRFGQVYHVSHDLSNICRVIQKQKKKVICINDDDIDDFTEAKECIKNAFETILPDKSSFEI